nr:MAG TPA: hypothetical protein [Caudoviricetes sp.]
MLKNRSRREEVAFSAQSTLPNLSARMASLIGATSTKPFVLPSVH